jgi:hypothetical protein
MKSSSTNSVQRLKTGDLRGKVNADIIEDSYVFMRQIKGTPAYWRNELMNLLARINTLGAPTWFITLSAGDLQWPDLFNLLTQGKKELHTLSSSDKWKLMRPILVAKQFNCRKQAFLKYILKGKRKPLGEIENYFL